MCRQNLLTAGNSTMPRSVGIWNLPAPQTCTPSSWCEEHCYACQNRYKWQTVQEAYHWRYCKSHEVSFVHQMIEEISRRRSLHWIRVHISGDFYSRKYVESWAQIAEEFPGITFRTNTKRQDLLPHMVKVFPKNFVVRESIDVTREATGLVPVHAIVGTPRTDDYFVCCNDCTQCCFHCWVYPGIDVRTATIL